tara:strand:- start:4570 stop:5535 length:966 start_codon:yes stop_codon:yes gene_type:complete
MKIGNAVVIANASEMSEKEWQDLRHKSIGSSDAAAVMQMGRYGSPHEVWQTKTGRSTREMNFAMSLGHKMEPVILDLAADELCMEIAKPDLVLAHPDHPEMTCNLDGYATNPYGDVAIVEAKHAGSYLKSQLETWEKEGIPDTGSACEGWWVQIQYQMAITGIHQAYLAALCDKKFFVIPVPVVPSFVKAMCRDIPEWFRNHVVDDVMPEYTGKDSDYVERTYADTDHESDPRDMSAVKDDIIRARTIKLEIRKLKEALTLHEVRIKAEIGHAPTGMLGNEVVVKSKEVTRVSIDTKKLKAEYPAIAELCSKTSTSRRYTY